MEAPTIEQTPVAVKPTRPKLRLRVEEGLLIAG
jgi:hypothetical protein